MWLHIIAKLVILQLIAKASCFVNVAHTPAQGLQGQATMSEAPFPNTGWTADKVVDGNTYQAANGESCALMDFEQQYKSVWLNVQLPRRFSVAFIELYLRNEQLLARSSGFTIYAFYDDTFNPASLSPNDLVYHHDPVSGCPAPIQNITINRPVRQIVFTNNRPVGFQTSCSGSNNNLYTSIEICEIKVMGCDTSRYSTGCVRECPTCIYNNCDVFNGSCLDKCPDPNALTEQCIVCADSKYISNGQCVKCRGHCKNGEHCNKLSGECDSGCATQWTGIFCDQCRDHFYGTDCRTPCGHCINNDVCDKVTGQCTNGCKPHWQMDKCDVCSDHFYGIDCSTPCGRCLNNDVCDKVTGHCLSGCQNHWTGNRCDVCFDHFYGIDCNTPCGHCLNNDVCDSVTGRCPNGCQNHWAGNRCDVCRDNFYGGDCNTPCGHCINADICNKVTGQCSNGCQNHWTGDRCDVCSEYIYGTDCNTPCGHCKDKDVCGNTTGHCPNGCQNQWTGDRCDECVPYKYGPNCAFDCGHCKDGKSCVAKNGVCTDGCESGWIGDLCIKAELNSPDFETNKNKLTTTGVAIIASVSTLFAISLFAIFFMGRHIMKNKTKIPHNTVYVPKNEKPPQTYVDLSTMDDNHAYSTLGSSVPETPYNLIGDSPDKI